MRTKTLDYPKILSKPKVYYESTEGTAAIKTTFTTATLRLTAKKFLSEIDLSMEVIEDAQNDMQAIAREIFAGALAEAEEQAMIIGDPAHSPTTATEASETASTWFTKDHRMIWYGLLTLAADIAGVLGDDTRAANRVDGGGGAMSTAIIRQAMYNLGKYGRVMQNLLLILNPWSSNQLLDDAKLVTLDKYGPQATIFTGEFGKLYGKVAVINSAQTTDGYGVITHIGNPIIGDRRRVKIKTDEEIKEDVKVFVLSERADFQVMHKAALCQVWNLESPSTIS